MIDYLRRLSAGRVVLWCYLIWYLATVWFYFDPSPRLWLNSLGISVVIGLALTLSVSRPGGPAPDRWQTFRLFLVPFCVSSFSSLIKDRGYLLILPPRIGEQLISIGLCLLFVALVALLKRRCGSRG